MSKTREALAAMKAFLLGGSFAYPTSLLAQIDAALAEPEQETDYKALYEQATEQYNELAKFMANKPVKPEQEPVAWLPMGSAPKDGTSVRLLVESEDCPMQDASPSITIGAFGVHGGPDADPTWDFAGWSWSHDCYVRGTGTPIGWLPLLANSPSPQPRKWQELCEYEKIDVCNAAEKAMGADKNLSWRMALIDQTSAALRAKNEVKV